MQPNLSKQFPMISARYGRGEATLKKMRVAVLESIYANGFHQTTICEIVRRAKLTRGAFYNYWDSLHDCLADIISSCQRESFLTDIQKEASSNLRHIQGQVDSKII